MGSPEWIKNIITTTMLMHFPLQKIPWSQPSRKMTRKRKVRSIIYSSSFFNVLTSCEISHFSHHTQNDPFIVVIVSPLNTCFHGNHLGDVLDPWFLLQAYTVEKQCSWMRVFSWSMKDRFSTRKSLSPTLKWWPLCVEILTRSRPQ